MSFNLAVMLRESRNAKPDHPLCHISDLTFSYAQVDEISGRVASALLGAGLRRGDKVAVQLLNPLLKAPEVAYQLEDSESRLLITFEGFAAEAVAGARQAGNVPTYVVNLPGHDQRPEGTRHYDELYFADDTGEIEPTDAEDTAVLIYTSGTTGKPKGAELTHFQLYMNCTVAGELFGARSDDVTLGVLPFFHVFGLSSITNVSVRYGGCLSIVPRFAPGAVLDTLEGDRCTVIGGVPTMLHALAQQDITGRDLSALRVAVSGGASLPEDVMRTFESKYGIEVLEGYGMSETASSCSFNRPGDRRVLSIGKPLWGVTMRVAGAEDRPLPPGREHVGEILIRGHNVMKGYLNRPEATAETLRGGWLHSGDLGYRDDDGFYFIVDRAKDLIIRGGYNVYPREIEEVLYGHPDIVEAAVIGKPDERLGEEVVAVVVRREGSDLGADEILAY